jgi:hypothetical protein
MQTSPPPPPTDEELDNIALTRYALLGIDVAVLPVDDPSAPIDLRRLLANARSTMRADVVAADFFIDAQFHVPALYPAPFTAWTGEES